MSIRMMIDLRYSPEATKRKDAVLHMLEKHEVETLSPKKDQENWETKKNYTQEEIDKKKKEIEENYRIIETYQGCVLDTREYNGYNDSDFYAIVWDEEKQKLDRIEYATTRGWTYLNGAGIDATEEVREKARLEIKKWAIGYMHKTDVLSSRKITTGKICKVFRGRKIAKGSIVRVIETFVSHFGAQWNRPKDDNTAVVEVKGSDGKRIWTAMGNLEVFNPEQYYRTNEEIERYAESYSRQKLYHMPFVGSATLVM